MVFGEFQEIFEKLEKIHPNLFSQISKKRFENEMKIAERNWGNLNIYDQIYEVKRLRAMLGDAHIDISFDEYERRYPFKIKKLKEGFCVVDLDETLIPKEVLYTKILAINQIPLDEVVEIMKPIISMEKGVFYLEAENVLTNSLYYKLFDISSDGKINLTLQNDEKIFDVNVAPFPKKHKPQYLQKPIKNCIFEDRDTYFYVNINKFKWEEGLHLNQLYADLLIATKNGKPLIIDVRDNYGGNIRKANVWTDILKKNNAKGYCLINHNSFSASVFTAQKLKKMGFTLVGEPAGQMATFYGAVISSPFVTRNSILIRCPTAKIDSNSQKYYKTDYYSQVCTEDEPLKPDVFIGESLADLKDGNDPALEYCIEAVKNDAINRGNETGFEFEEMEFCP